MRALAIAALFALAGCSGMSRQAVVTPISNSPSMSQEHAQRICLARGEAAQSAALSRNRAQMTQPNTMKCQSIGSGVNCSASYRTGNAGAEFAKGWIASTDARKQGEAVTLECLADYGYTVTYEEG